MIHHADADNVKVVIEMQYWDKTFNAYHRYPDISPETHDYTNFSAGHPYSISYKPKVSGSVAGCHLDSQNPNKVNCKYRVVADVTYKQDTDPSGPGMILPGGRPSSSGWIDGAHCEDVASWSVTQ